MSEDLYGEGDDNSGTVFRDTIMLALAGFVSLVVLLLPFINPPAETESTKSDPPGNVIIEVFWPEDRDVDLDLWVKAPDDIPVGYSNRGGIFLYPSDKRLKNKQGRLRLTYEANPLAMLIKEAGGQASNGIKDILDVDVEDIHQRSPLIFGSSEEVEEFIYYSRNS